MKRIDWIRQSGTSVNDVAEMFGKRGCPVDVCGYCVTVQNCTSCYERYLNEEIKTPAELETQTGAQKNTTDNIVTQVKENVNMRTKEEIKAEIKRLEAEEEKHGDKFLFGQRLVTLRWVMKEWD